MMMYIPKSITVVVCLLLAIIGVIVRALPDGAPVCTTGVAAPGNPHNSPGRNPITGPLDGAGFIVKVGGEVISTETPTTVNANEDVRVEVTSEGGEQPFRGALIIVSKTGTSLIGAMSLTEEDEAKLQMQSTICNPTGAEGVTHIDNELKTSVEATMRFTENLQEVLLDVNIVIINRLVSAGGSFYYYSQYKINVEGATPPPTPPTISKCGLFSLGLFCPFNGCGFFGRWIFGDDFC